jgi:hypothetical protein
MLSVGAAALHLVASAWQAASLVVYILSWSETLSTHCCDMAVIPLHRAGSPAAWFLVLAAALAALQLR